MKRLLRLDQHPSGPDVAEVMAQNPGAAIGALFWDGRVRLFGPGCQHKTLEAAAAGVPAHAQVWTEGHSPDSATREGGRTHAALRLLAQQPGLTAHAAAKQAGVHVSAVYRALERAARPACPCCGRPVPA